MQMVKLLGTKMAGRLAKENSLLPLVCKNKN